MEILYLAHHGILGQKWGVRRFQNEDGSLTPEGARRYDVAQKKSEYRAQKKEYADSLRSRKKAKHLAGTPEEEQAAIRRHEKAYKDLIDAKASLAVSKKIGYRDRDKAELKTYQKELKKKIKQGRFISVKNLSDHMEVTKGRDFVTKVETNLAKELLIKTAVIAAGAVTIRKYLGSPRSVF